MSVSLGDIYFGPLSLPGLSPALAALKSWQGQGLGAPSQPLPTADDRACGVSMEARKQSTDKSEIL